MARKDTERELRFKIFDMLDEGWTSEDVAELLDLKHMQVCGYMSWRTKGHYEAEERERREGKPHLRVVK